MLISSAPIAIPVNTANIPTEAASAEAIQRPKIPQPTSPAENPSSKNSTEFGEQVKSQVEEQLKAEQQNRLAEKEQSKQQNAQSEQEKAEARQVEEQEIEEQKIVQQLQSRDREVRAHEQAHAAAGGALAGAAKLNYTTGPDGKRYATSGEVSIDVSKVAGDPEATLRKLQQVQRAALAPAEPSSQDLKVAAQASIGITKARNEINLERFSESQSVNERTDLEENKQEAVESSGSSDNIQASLNSPSQTNPMIARRQAAQLNQRISGSGAVDSVIQGSYISINA